MSCCILAGGGEEVYIHESTYDPIGSNSVPAQYIAGSDGGHVDVAVEAVEHAAQPVAFPAA